MSVKKLSVRTGRGGNFTAASDAALDAAAAEADRLASLYAYGVLDTPPEEDFDQIVALAAEICGTPIALVSLVDADRQWFKARVGLDVAEAPRSTSFCQYAIVGADDVMEVPDTRLDERFAANPLVTGEPHLRFYAAAVLRDRQGRGLGTLCVFDLAARRLSAVQLGCLASLGRHVTALLEVRRGSAALAHAETALDAAVDGRARRAVIALDTDLRITGWSGDAERLYGYPAIAMVGRPLSKVLAAELTVSNRKKIAALLEGRGWWEGDLVYHRRDGSPVRVRVRVEARRDPDGKRIGYLVRTEDRTSPDIERLCHQTYVDIVTRMANGKPLASLSADLCRVVDEAFPGAHATLTAADGDTAPRAEGLTACWSQPIVGPAGVVLGTFGVYWDRPHEPGGDERQLVTTLASLAGIVLTARRAELGGDWPDDLTGLLTRVGLDRALARLAAEPAVCVVALGVDRFGLVNRQYGLDIGDSALRQIAERVRSVGAVVPIVARFASDQFILATATDHCGTALADQLIAALRQPMNVDGNELWLTASVGIARGSGAQGQAVMHAAVAAAGRARRLGGNQALDADLPPLDLATSSLALVGALHRAVASGGLQVHYQPKVSVATGAVEGFEALVRWPRGDGTTVAPSDFVPLAEEIGIIDTIGRQVLRQACADAAGWPAQASGATIGVAVNVSGRQLIPGQLAATIAAALTDSGLPAHRLTIEVTETALVGDFESAIGALREVKALGVRVSIDDFGTGYSSLGYLSRFPIDELKIDRSFIERLGRDAAVDAIVRSVIALSHTLGLRCTAEGVERDDQLDHLAALGCDTFQGYLFSPAVPNASVDLCVAARLGVA
jgi:diguanylate cyclase (GGDEF)-like protein/PAS domain S-box-containing protein